MLVNFLNDPKLASGRVNSRHQTFSGSWCSLWASARRAGSWGWRRVVNCSVWEAAKPWHWTSCYKKYQNSCSLCQNSLWSTEDGGLFIPNLGFFFFSAPASVIQHGQQSWSSRAGNRVFMVGWAWSCRTGLVHMWERCYLYLGLCSGRLFLLSLYCPGLFLWASS